MNPRPLLLLFRSRDIRVYLVVNLSEHLAPRRIMPILPKYADMPLDEIISAHRLYDLGVEIDTLVYHAATCSIPFMSCSYSVAAGLSRGVVPAVAAMVRVSVSSS